MSIEGGARIGYVNPDETTFEFLRGRPFAPKDGDAFEHAVAWWRQMASDADARYDDRVDVRRRGDRADRHLGHQPGPVGRASPSRSTAEPDDEALAFMGFKPGSRVQGTRIDVAFIGSCTNGRLSDLEEAARIVKGHHVAPHVKALVVPGIAARSAARPRRAGCTRSSCAAGFEWRGAGCSMCLGMNPDKLEGRQVCASSSNRNFKGRQGSPTGRTLLMSPAMVAAAAIAGEVVDVREMLGRSAGMSQRLRAVSDSAASPRQRPRPPAARPRHRHRPHHAGALSASPSRSKGSSSTCSRTIARPIRSTRSTIRAIDGASILVVNTQLRLRLVARARAAGARARRHPRDRRRVVLGDLPGQLGDARACPASRRATTTIERLQTLIETDARRP